MTAKRLQVFIEKNSDGLAEKGAQLFEQKMLESLKEKGHFSVALSGGSTPRGMHRTLAGRPTLPWEAAQIFWGDERCVSATDPSSNYGTAWEDLLGKIPLSAEQIHPMPGQMKPDQGARQYERELTRAFSLGEGSCQFPEFDMIFLGLGKDGHTASLFPGQSSLMETKRMVVAVRGGDPDVSRLTLTYPVLNMARQVVFMVSGEEKAQVARAVLEAKDERLPARRVQPVNGFMTWLLDREAASLLSEKILSSFHSKR
jgi:6-phosphogluconolactonase